MWHLFHSWLRMERSNIGNQNRHSASNSMHMKQRQGDVGEEHRGQNLLLSSAVIEQNEDKTQFKFRNHNIYTTCEPLHCTNHNHKVRVWEGEGRRTIITLQRIACWLILLKSSELIANLFDTWLTRTHDTIWGSVILGIGLSNTCPF